MRSTVTEAFREMRNLLDTNAGRLRGLPVRYLSRDIPYTAPQSWHEQIRAGVATRRAGTLAPDSPEYLVVSDDTVILVLTADARLLRPDIALTGLQTKHQRQAAEALTDLIGTCQPAAGQDDSGSGRRVSTLRI